MANDKPKSIAEQLAEGYNPGAAATPATPALSASSITAAGLGDTNLLAQLLQLMLLKEGREVAKLQQEENARATRQAQRDRNGKERDARYLLNQAKCKHIKGGTKRGAKLRQVTDYAVYQHTFIDGSTSVKCRICGAHWHPNDTVEFLVRKGKKISNWTKIGWQEALALTDQSSDKPSSSEMPQQALIGNLTGATPSFTDRAGQKVNLTPTDAQGQAVPDFEY